ncbi:hypothetical protein EKG95_23255 [Salmonella enterica subsp. enterica serovar Aqua]|uniref:Uncharacterized protein n=1 Tax=Salmonella enterica subsp. enterica serovar Aqua TaxID=1302615 RepID=A0A5X6ESU9_SALET|nr:hypothetical protein [Salmonella enterica subsp. enterica serovar Aqua]
MKNFMLTQVCSVGRNMPGQTTARNNDFVGLPLLIFTFVFIPPVFIGIHYPILILMNVVLLTERSDRFAVFYTTRNA